MRHSRICSKVYANRISVVAILAMQTNMQSREETNETIYRTRCTSVVRLNLNLHGAVHVADDLRLGRACGAAQRLQRDRIASWRTRLQDRPAAATLLRRRILHPALLPDRVRVQRSRERSGVAGGVHGRRHRPVHDESRSHRADAAELVRLLRRHGRRGWLPEQPVPGLRHGRERGGDVLGDDGELREGIRRLPGDAGAAHAGPGEGAAGSAVAPNALLRG